jgi:F-type H+-transporting ATPase subunit b
MRRGWLSLVMGLALIVLSSPPATAEDHPAPAAKDHAASGHDGKGEEPAGIPWGPRALDLSIWTIVVFLVLLWVLSKYAWKPMIEGLDHRERAIAAAVEEAQRARDEAARLREQLQAEMNRASEKVRDMLDEARKEGQALREQLKADAHNEIQGERDRLHREIDLARDQALQQIWNQAAKLAATISTKAIRRQLTPEDHRQLVEEALADLRRAGTERQRMVASIQ